MHVPTKDQKQGRGFGWRLRCVEAPAGVPLCLLLHTNRVNKFRRRVTLPVNELSNIVKLKCPLYELFSEYCMNKIKQMQDRHFFDLVCQLWSQNQLVTRHWLPLVVLQAARFRHVVPVWGPPILAELELWCHIHYVSTQTHAHTHTNTLPFFWLIFSSVRQASAQCGSFPEGKGLLGCHLIQESPRFRREQTWGYSRLGR